MNFYDRAGAEIGSSIIATRSEADPVVTEPFAINVTVRPVARRKAGICGSSTADMARANIVERPAI